MTQLISVKQNSPEWHEWRKKVIGASEVSALFDANPYFTKRDLWFEKAGFAEINVDPDGWAVQKGQALEPKIRAAISKYAGLDMQPVCMQDGIFGASLDAYGNGIVAEAKFTGKENLKKANDKGEVPYHHYIQIQQQLMVAQADKGFWVGTDGKICVAVEVGRNEDFISDIKDKGELFWRSIADFKVPDIGPKDTMFVTSEDALALAKKYEELDGVLARLSKEHEALKEQLKDLATHPICQIGKVKVLEITRTGNIDYKKIPAIKNLDELELEIYRSKSTTYKKVTVG